jgi:serine acetyltransferase
LKEIDSAMFRARLQGWKRHYTSVMGFFQTLWVCARKGFPLRVALACDINYNTLRRMPGSTVIPHPVGIVIKDDTIIGEGCTILQNSSIVRRYPVNLGIYSVPDEKTIIGSGVFIGDKATILGAVKIGNRAIIGAGAIVLKDVPEDTFVVGVWK